MDGKKLLGEIKEKSLNLLKAKIPGRKSGKKLLNPILLMSVIALSHYYLGILKYVYSFVL